MNGHGILDPAFLSKIERLALAVKRARLGASKGERRSKRKGAGLEFADYRDYVQGDELRHVDWNVFSRLDALHLRLFQDQEDLTLHLLIDASASMGFGTPTKIAFACRLAAALGYIALVGYDRVTTEALSGSYQRTLAPIRGRSSARKLFSFLESIEAEGPTALERGCSAHLMSHRAPGISVLISDFLDYEGFEGCLRTLGASSMSDVYAVHVLAPEEVDPQVSGDLKLLDSETGSAVEVSVSHSLLERYHARRERFCESIRRYCVSRGIGHVMACSDTSIERLTLDVLRKAGILR
jgi:uncharacterized protein (DUF58 family)